MRNLKSTLSASQARTNFYTILSDVGKKSKRYTITKNGTAQAIVLSPEEVESWEETMEILANEELVRDIRQGLDDIKEGRTISHEALLKKLNISASDLA